MDGFSMRVRSRNAKTVFESSIHIEKNYEKNFFFLNIFSCTEQQLDKEGLTSKS